MARSTGTGAKAFLALSCVSAALAPGFAAAQDGAAPAESEQRLGGMTVTDTAIDDGVKVDRLESPKYVRPLAETPQTITVIGKESIKQQNLLTLREILQTVPGITFGAGEGGFGYGDRIILNGVDAKNDITVDGVRSGAVLNRNETYNIEQVEITTGANSVYAGGGSVAGTINLVTKRPLADDQIIVNAGVGTDNYYRATVDANKRVGENVAVRLNAVYHENDVPGRDVEFYERWGIAPAVTIGIDGPTSLTLQYEHLNDEGMPQYGIRYYPDQGGFLPEFDRSGYYGFANIDRQDSKIDSFQAIFAHEFSDSLKIRNLTRYENIRQHTVTSQPNGDFCLSTGVQPNGNACAATVAPGFFMPNRGNGRGNTRFIRNETAYNQFDVTADFNTGGIEHSMVVGVSALWEKYNQRSGNSLRAADGTNPNATSYPLVSISNPGQFVQGPPGFVYGDNNYDGPFNFIQSGHAVGEQTSYAAYLFDVMKFTDWFELNGGIRYEQVKGSNYNLSYDTTPGPTLGDTSLGATTRLKNNLFSYRIGAVFKPLENVSLYVAHGTSKLPSKASVNDSCSDAVAGGTCNVNPETTKNYEIGVKAELFDKRLLLTASAFRNDRDQIKVLSPDPTRADQATDGFQRVQGISLGASGNITDNWTISANYTYLDSEIKRGVSDFCLANPGVSDPTLGTCANSADFPDPTRGSALTNAPKHSGSLFTTYRFDFGLQLGYGINYQGKFLLNQPSLAQLAARSYVAYYVPSYTIHRFMASYPVTENLTAQVNVQNFTNEKYVTTVRNNVNSSWAQPGPTRQAVFSINYTF